MTNSTHVLKHVASNLKHYRDAKNLTQQQLADLSGVSRRTISGLESGQDNISLAKLGWLADVLEVSFVDLVRAAAQPAERIHEQLWQGQTSQSYAKILSSCQAKQHVEMWECSLAPNEIYCAEPDPAGWHEMIFVIEGQLTLDLNNQPVTFSAGQSHVYASDVNYRYINSGSTVVRFMRNCVN